MEEQNGIRLACPYCGQHLNADADMAGMVVECPACGQSLIVPSDEAEQSEAADTPECRRQSVYGNSDEAGARKPCGTRPVIKVVRKKRERCIDKFKNQAKAAGIGLAVLLFVGAGVLMEFHGEEAGVANETGMASETSATTKAVEASLKCLASYIETPTEKRYQALSGSLETCPSDFKEAVRNFLAAMSKSRDDMISEKERDEALAATVVLGLLAGAVSDSSGEAFSSGMQIGNLVNGEVQRKAQSRLEQEIKSRFADVVDVARKYGVDLDG